MKLFSVFLLTCALVGSSHPIQANDLLDSNQDINESASNACNLETRAKKNCHFFKIRKERGPTGPTGHQGTPGPTGTQGPTGVCCSFSGQVAFGQVIASGVAGCTGGNATVTVPGGCGSTMLVPLSVSPLGGTLNMIAAPSTFSGVMALQPATGFGGRYSLTYDFSGFVVVAPFTQIQSHGLLFRLAIDGVVSTPIEQTLQRYDGINPFFSPALRSFFFLPINVSGSGIATLNPGNQLVLQIQNTKATPCTLNGISCSITAELLNQP